MLNFIQALCSIGSILVLLGAVSPGSLPQPENPYAQLEQHVVNAIKAKKVVGTSIAIVDQGRITFMKSFGLRKQGGPASVDNDTVFQLGSLSKPVAASLFAVALKQGRANLNSPVVVGKINWPNTQVRHLLSHTSGLSRNGWNWQIEHGASRAMLIDLLAKKTREQPGKTFDYHNVAFSLIEDVLEKSFSVPFERALREHVFDPLAMKNTTTGFKSFTAQPNRAWPHEFDNRGRCVASKEYSHRYHDTVISAAGINSNIKDMAQFLKLQLGDYPKILSVRDLKPLHSIVVAAPDATPRFKNQISGEYSSHYGYGFRILKQANRLLIFHGGWLKGFTSFLIFDPQSRRGIVMLSNTENPFSMTTAVDYILGRFGS